MFPVWQSASLRITRKLNVKKMIIQHPALWLLVSTAWNELEEE